MKRITEKDETQNESQRKTKEITKKDETRIDSQRKTKDRER